MIGELEVEVVRLNKLKFVNDCIQQNPTNTLQLYNDNNNNHFKSAKSALTGSVVGRFLLQPGTCCQWNGEINVPHAEC